MWFKLVGGDIHKKLPDQGLIYWISIMNYRKKEPTSTDIISRCIELSMDSYAINHRKKQRIECNNGNVLFLKEGGVSLYKKIDNLLSIKLEAPAIIGLSDIFENFDYHYMRCDTDCKIIVLQNNMAIDLLDRECLWRHAFEIIIWYQGLYLQRERMMGHSNVLNIVDEHIKLIWSMPEETRKKTSIYTYITSRNHISRSAIHKAVQEMRSCNLIDVDRGKLINYRGGKLANR